MAGTEEFKPKNFFIRLWGTCLSPSETFREVGRSPAVLVPIIALIIFGFLQGFYLTKYFDMESALNMSAAQAQTQGQLTPEQKERVEQQRVFITKFLKVITIVSTSVSSVLVALIVAGVFKLISKLVGVENGFKAIFCVTAYAMLAVSIISFALLVLVASFKDPSELTYANMRSLVSSNLGAILGGLLGEDSLPKFFMNLARYVDAFAIWMIALLSIGYSAISVKLKAARVATWLGVLYGIIALIGATFGSLVSPK
jgi:hypothetical protein